MFISRFQIYTQGEQDGTEICIYSKIMDKYGRKYKKMGRDLLS